MRRSPQAAADQTIIKQGEPCNEMYWICRGEVEVLDSQGRIQAVFRDGDCFGEMALLSNEPRNATVRARTPCNLFVLARADFSRILRDHQQFAQAIKEIAQERYQRAFTAEQLANVEKPFPDFT